MKSTIYRLRVIATVSLALLAFTQCSEKLIEEPQEDITFKVMNEGEISSVQTTKGQRYNSESEFASQTFGVYAWDTSASPIASIYANESVDKSTGKWKQTTTPVQTWTNNKNYVFEAVYPQPSSPLGSVGLTALTTSSTPGDLTFSYAVPTTTNAAEDKDFMLAYYSGVGCSGGVPLTFTHPLTCVNFKADELTGISKINSITISGVYASGSCDVRTATYGSPARQCYSYEQDNAAHTSLWRNLTGSISVTGTSQINAASLSTSQTAYNFLLIPQNTATQNAKLTINITTEHSETYDITATISTDYWRAGYTNTYKVSFDGNLTLKLDAQTYRSSSGVYDTYQLTANRNSLTFNNTTADSDTMRVKVNCSKTVSTAPAETAPWVIKSYKIGTGSEVSVDGTSFMAGGLTVTTNSAADSLVVSASARTEVSKGSHAYWTGGHGLFSPADWSGTYTISNPLDLSKFDFKTETADAHAMTTANCYVIRHAGTYKIPLVYGNGVIDGLSNTQAYTFTSGTDILAAFTNHLGNAVASPYIEDNTGCQANSAQVLWQDQDVVVTNLSITGTTQSSGYNASTVRYLQFTVDNTTVRENNAIIAIKDSYGDIIWSWHIWTTNNPALLQEPVSIAADADFFPISSVGHLLGNNYSLRDDVAITLTPKNDESKSVTITVTQPELFDSDAIFYQWGRKDPIPSITTLAPGSITISSGPLSIADAIKAPATIITNSNTAGSWNSSPKINLWGATGASATTSVKTIYDPSPVGYKVPVKSAFSSLTTSDGTWTGQGWNFSAYPIYFPALGYRSHGDGQYRSQKLGVQGEYWTSNTINASTGQATPFYFINNTINTIASNSQAYAYSVRPTVDEVNLPVLPGLFTVAVSGTDSTKVYFSNGNLYYNGSQFKFETTQYAYTSSYDASHVCRFRWAAKSLSLQSDITSAIGTGTSLSGSTSDVFFTNATRNTPRTDFVVNGFQGIWRTLSKDEWAFLLSTRLVNGRAGEGWSCQRATINSDGTNVWGLIIYPDNYKSQTGATSYTTADWTAMESAGCVFLPSAGLRDGTRLGNLNNYGRYWSSTPYSSVDRAYFLRFNENQYLDLTDGQRYYGSTVRLVYDVD